MKAGSERPNCDLQEPSSFDKKTDSERPNIIFERPNSSLEGRRSPAERHRSRITNFEQRKSSFEALTKECSRNKAAAELDASKVCERPLKELEETSLVRNVNGRNWGSESVKENASKSPFVGVKPDAQSAKCMLRKSLSEEAKPSPRSKFDRLRQNFETGNLTEANTATNKLKPDHIVHSKKRNVFLEDPESASQKLSETTQKPPVNAEKPQPLKPKPSMVKVLSDSKLKTQDLSISDEFKSAKKSGERKFATEARRYRKSDNSAATGLGLTLARRERNHQLDVDKENVST